MNSNRRDIFDKIMDWECLSIFRPFYKKNKEVLLYLFFGGLSFVVSVLTYAFFIFVCNFGTIIANIWSWIITVMFAFLTNRIWVFDSPTENIIDFFKQMGTFYGGRVITLIIEDIILFVFIDKMHGDSILIKVIAQIIVIILNYIISKMIIFKHDGKSAL